jgi:hypothetical protein
MKPTKTYIENLRNVCKVASLVNGDVVMYKFVLEASTALPPEILERVIPRR